MFFCRAHALRAGANSWAFERTSISLDAHPAATSLRGRLGSGGGESDIAGRLGPVSRERSGPQPHWATNSPGLVNDWEFHRGALGARSPCWSWSNHFGRQTVLLSSPRHMMSNSGFIRMPVIAYAEGVPTVFTTLESR